MIMYCVGQENWKCVSFCPMIWGPNIFWNMHDMNSVQGLLKGQILSRLRLWQSRNLIFHQKLTLLPSSLPILLIFLRNATFLLRCVPWGEIFTKDSYGDIGLWVTECWSSRVTQVLIVLPYDTLRTLGEANCVGHMLVNGVFFAFFLQNKGGLRSYLKEGYKR